MTRWLLLSGLAGCQLETEPSRRWTQEAAVAGIDVQMTPEDLLANIRAQDPAEFDAAPSRPAISLDQWTSVFSRPLETQIRWELLTFLAIEVQARRPGVKVPSAKEIESLVSAGGPPYAQARDSLKTALLAPAGDE